MAIQLQKGVGINLTKTVPSLTKIRFELGWVQNQFDTGGAADVDASVFMLEPAAGGASKLISDECFVFYNNPNSPDGAVHHGGDNRVGLPVAKAGEVCEVITVDLTKLNPKATELSFVITIHDPSGKLNFGQVKHSFIRLIDDSSNQEIAKYDLEDDFSAETALQFGSLYKKDSSWLFKAVGAGYKKGLADFVTIYGGNVA